VTGADANGNGRSWTGPRAVVERVVDREARAHDWRIAELRYEEPALSLISRAV
jgi:hypothetical protein